MVALPAGMGTAADTHSTAVWQAVLACLSATAPGPLPPCSPQRWLTSGLLHQSFVHMFSNGLMLAGLGGQMEAKYGSWRIAALTALSVLGGNLFRWGRVLAW